MNKNIFVVLTQQRSGSIWLSTLINEHASIVLLPELFQVNKKNEEGYYNGKGSIREFVLDLIASNNYHTVGFKLMFDQIEHYPDIVRVLKELNVKIIRLKRNNLLDIHVSKLVANKNKVWASGDSNKLSSLSPVNVNLETLISDLDKLKKMSVELDAIAADFPTYELSYEELYKEISLLNGVFEFLGVDEISIKNEKTKKIVKSKELSVENWPSVCQVISNSSYRGMEKI